MNRLRVSAPFVLAVLALTVVATAAGAGPGNNTRIAFAAERGSYDFSVYRVSPGAQQRSLTGTLGAQTFEPTPSPDGKRIAFSTTDGGSASLWVMKAQGSSRHEVASGIPRTFRGPGYDVLSPSWAPDGKSIAIETEEGIAIVSLRTGHMKHVAPRGTLPSWSPDGRRIAFIHAQRLRVVDVSGKHLHVVGPSASVVLSTPAWSPNGHRIAVTAARPFLAHSGYFDYRWDLYAVSASTGHARQLTHKGGRLFKYDPAWSSDGRIVFGQSRGLWTIGPTGKGLHRLTEHHGPGSDWAPTWSSDGKRVAFVRDGSTSSDILSVPARGGRPRPLTMETLSVAYQPRWIGHSHAVTYTLAMRQGGSIETIRADGSGHVRLTNSSFDDSYPAWSPDGTKIAFTRTLATGDRQEIFVMDGNGSHVTRITHHPGADLYPSWSPDGTKILFVQVVQGYFWISIMDADGTNVKHIYRSALPGAWSPDGTTIAIGTGSGIVLVTPTGKFVKRIAPLEGSLAGFPEWSPDGTTIAFSRLTCGFDFCPRARIEVVGADGSHDRVFGTDIIYATWSPDGTELAYDCGFFSICREPVAGGQQSEVWPGSDEAPANTPNWQP